jgi:hypothetical protein
MYNVMCIYSLFTCIFLCGVVSLHKVVEVREGQKTRQFDKFPFEQVSGQSFSLIFEEERRSNESSVWLLHVRVESIWFCFFFSLDRQEVCTSELPGFHLWPP